MTRNAILPALIQQIDCVAVSIFRNLNELLTEVIWEELVALAQLRKKVSIRYSGMPQIHPQNCPFPYNRMYCIVSRAVFHEYSVQVVQNTRFITL